MTTPWVLDTSVIIKWFRQDEIHADVALALRRDYLQGEIAIIVPTLLIYEIANVLRYKQDLQTEEVERAVDSLLTMQLGWIAPTISVVQRAVRIAREYDTSVYDASFAAVAEATGASFVTADERLVRRLAALPQIHFLGDIEASETL